MIPHIKGKVSSQAHVSVPEGLYEEEYARKGFFGRYAHLYRTEPPVGWTGIEGDLRPMAFDLRKLSSEGGVLESRRPVLRNEDVTVEIARFSSESRDYFRNADCDEAFFVHEGQGRLETDFGPITYDRGDYIIMPRGTVYRFAPKSSTYLLICESRSEFELPEKGMLGQHALFDPAMIRVPEPEQNVSKSSAGNYTVLVKRLGKISKIHYPFCPINAVGWKGTLSPWQLNVRDIRPVLSDRYHLPPSAHTTFVARGFVICTFLPRPLENGDQEAMKVPFYHSNIDYDEVLFYHDGEFFSREGIDTGMLTFHPQGIHHGPQPGAVERTKGVTHTKEVAVMIDTQRPLEVVGIGLETEVKEYWKSWRKS